MTKVRFALVCVLIAGMIFPVFANGQKEPAATVALSAIEADEQAMTKELAEWQERDFSSPQYVDRSVTVPGAPAGLEWHTSDAPVFGSERAKQGGTYNYFLGEYPQTFRVLGPNGNQAFRGFLLTSLGMVGVNYETKEWMPSAATHWAFGEDGKTVYYKLNENMMWSDGVPVTADDYTFVLDYMRSPNINDPWYNTYYTEQITDIVKVNDYCVAVTFRNEAVSDILISSTSISPKPRHFYPNGIPENFVEEYNWKAEPTTGPYYLESYEQGEWVRFKKVENWWGHNLPQNKHRFNPEYLRYRVVTGGNDIIREYFNAGEIDWFAQIIPEEWANGNTAETFTNGYVDRYYSTYVPMQGMQGIFFNTSHHLFSDINVRKGMYYAIDIQGMIDTALRGEYERNHNMGLGHVFAGIEFDNDEIRKPDFDPAIAGEYFDEAGYSIIGNDGIRRNDSGQRLEFELLYSWGGHTERLTVLREQAVLAGLDLKLNLQTSGMFTTVLEKRHHAAWFGMNTSQMPDYYQFFHSSNVQPQTNNFFMWSSDEMDALVEGFRAAATLEEKAEINKQVQQIVHDEALFIPHYYVPFWRGAAWKWVRYPAWMNNQYQDGFFDLFNNEGYGWIDQDIKAEVQEAQRTGNTFEPRIHAVNFY